MNEMKLPCLRTNRNPITDFALGNMATSSSNDLSDIFTLNHQGLLASIALPLLFLALATLLRLSGCSLLGPKLSRKVFLLDFACYKAPPNQICTKEMMIEKSWRFEKFSDSSLEFMKKLLERSGLGESTYVAEALLREPPNPCLEEARKETEMVIFGAVDDLFAKTGVKGKDIGILIVNCCVFNVVPSLPAMIVNRYKLREKVNSYNLSGMGCSAGIKAIGLAHNLLQVHHNSYALVVSTENITENCYLGDDRSKLLVNVLFRVGGAAILLSNRPSDRHVSKYQLLHSVCTNTASSDSSYNCIFQEEDSHGQVGVTITKDLLSAASKAIEANVTTLGRLVLPIQEKIRYVTRNFLLRNFLPIKTRRYIPDFKKVVDHVITHVGGKPVLDEVERKLKLTETHMEPSRMTLYRFGNTSSSSVWYGLGYAEAKGRIKKGDRVWQIAFGSGFKCASVIWQAMKAVDQGDERNPWTSEIEQFPVNLQNVGAFPEYFE